VASKSSIHDEKSSSQSCYQSLQQDERDRINAEHEQIIRAVRNFREELKCVTTDRIMAMILSGMDVINLLRAHIAYEGEMLGRIAEFGKPSQMTADITGRRTSNLVS
jgi:hypothetical protein